MSAIEEKYIFNCKNPSDINEHLPTLKKYADECSHITECGVRFVVSSYAFALSLKGKENNKLVQADIKKYAQNFTFEKECVNENVNMVFYEQSDLECPLEKTELLFIDTWHIYGHLKRELARWNTYVIKYIILHDTTTDAIHGETIRVGWDPKKQSLETGIPAEEITKGLWPAIEEFLVEHPEWKIKERFINNNGLTILERI
jgi:hypothetical protein